MRLGYGMTGTLRGVVFGAVLGVVCVGALVLAGAGLALNPERHYEMVSPVYKGGFGATSIEAVAADGESVAYHSEGAFAGEPSDNGVINYLARRGPAGWWTVPLILPAPFGPSRPQGEDVSPSLETVLQTAFPGSSAEDENSQVEYMYLHPTGLSDTPTDWELAGSFAALEGKEFLGVDELGADSAFCQIVIDVGAKQATPLLPQAGGVAAQLYDSARGCNGESRSLTLVSANNQGGALQVSCSVDLGIERYASSRGYNTYNAVNMDGSEVFFTDGLQTVLPCEGDQNFGANPGREGYQLFVRLGGVRTVEVSRPLVGEKAKSRVCVEVPCEEASLRAPAEFQGASEDGSRVYFTAALKAGQAPLVPGDTDASNNLYLASIGCPEGRPGCGAGEREVRSLSEVSHDPGGGAAGVQGVLRVAPDGERAYFVAEGDLLSAAQQQALEGQGRPVPQTGAENLYVYDAQSSGVAFVGDLCSGKELSGSVEDAHCPGGGSDASLWSQSKTSESQTAGPDGRFLVFATSAQLTGDDTNTVQDVYRYDAQTERLVRVSVGEDGFDANGNGGVRGSSILAGHHGSPADAPVRSQHEMNNRAVSEDGSRIVFVSAEPLSSKASNGLANVYEWHETPGGGGGGVSLLDSGSGELPVEDVVISPDGANVFFVTTERLVAQDSDEAPDIYDARLGAGFVPVAAERRPCEGDGCQGPLTNPAPLLVPGSTSQAAGENLAPPAPAAGTALASSRKASKSKARDHKAKPKRAKCRKSRRRAQCRSVARSKRGGRS